MASALTYTYTHSEKLPSRATTPQQAEVLTQVWSCCSSFCMKRYLVFCVITQSKLSQQQIQQSWVSLNNTAHSPDISHTVSLMQLICFTHFIQLEERHNPFTFTWGQRCNKKINYYLNKPKIKYSYMLSLIPAHGVVSVAVQQGMVLHHGWSLKLPVISWCNRINGDIFRRDTEANYTDRMMICIFIWHIWGRAG